MKVRHFLVLALLAFAITLAIVVGLRLSAEAMAVMVGVVAGVAASIPTSLIVVWLAARGQAAASSAPARREGHADEPRVVVITAPPQLASNPRLLPSSWATSAEVPPGWPAPLRTPRRFTVIGGAEDDL
jgi:hypothetical protein